MACTSFPLEYVVFLLDDKCCLEVVIDMEDGVGHSYLDCLGISGISRGAHLQRTGNSTGSWPDSTGRNTLPGNSDINALLDSWNNTANPNKTREIIIISQIQPQEMVNITHNAYIRNINNATSALVGISRYYPLNASKHVEIIWELPNDEVRE